MSSSDNNNKNAFPVRGAGFISQNDSFLHVATALDSTNNVRDDYGQPNPAPYPKRNEVFVDDQPEIASGSIADEKVVEKAQCRPQRWKVLATVLVIGIIVIIIAIVTTKGKNKSSPLSNYFAENSSDKGAALSTNGSSQQMALKFLEQSTLNNGPFDYTLLQVYALVVMNYATGNTRESESFTQLQGTTCDLDYITCNDEKDKITELLLQNPVPNLKGSIPPEIGLLKSLTALDFSKNALAGTLPSEIGLLTSLTYLDLSHNSFTGYVPQQISNLILSNFGEDCNLANGSCGVSPYP